MSHRKGRYSKRKVITVRKMIVAGLVGASLLLTPVAHAASRPTDDFHSGSANRSNCKVVYQHDRGYEYLIQVERGGEKVTRVVRRLPNGGNYTILEKRDLGVRQVVKCEY